ncbi:glycan biosynthesis hexose transferase WsfD [Arthrobacter sp. MMS24-S77]
MADFQLGKPVASEAAEGHFSEDFAPTRVRPAKGPNPGPLRRAARFLSRTFGPGELALGGVRTPAILAGVASALAMVLRLFIPGPVGLADQGDGHGLVCALGVRNVRPWDYGEFTRFVYPSWAPHEFFGEACGASGSGEPVYSSQLAFLWLGKLLTPLLGWGPGLDTRAVGVVCCIAFGLLIASLVAVLPGRTNFRLLVAGLVTAVMADGVFADFFISPYTEPAVFLGILALAVALLHYWNARGNRWLAVVFVAAAAAFTIYAKPEMVSWLPVLALALLWFPRGGARVPRRARVSGGSRWRGRILPLTAVVAVAAFSVAFLAAQPKRTAELALYNAVFAEILPHSPAPEEDLKWLGLDQSFITATGTTAASSRSATFNPTFPEFEQRVNPAKLAGFYATHPERLIGMGERGISAMLTPELGYIGSFMEGEGHEPFAKDRRFPVVLGLFSAMKAAPVILVAMQLLTLLLGLAVASRKKSAVGRLAVVVVVGGWLQFWTAMMMSGQPEIYRQLIVSGFLAALCVPLLVALVSILASETSESPLRDPPVKA